MSFADAGRGRRVLVPAAGRQLTGVDQSAKELREGDRLLVVSFSRRMAEQGVAACVQMITDHDPAE
jgi:hypothetical protein